MRVLFLGEIVGKAGHKVVKNTLKDYVRENSVHWVVANANGATGGFGLGKTHAVTLRKRGLGTLTLGEYAYYKKDMVDYLPQAPRILRPANLPPGIPGRGWGFYETPDGLLAVINLIGQSGYTRTHGSNPYVCLPGIVERIRERTNRIILNFHAAATAERRTMAFHADGLVSAMVGTGSRCLTADSQILPGGTMIITDSGRVGARGAVYGMDSRTEIRILKSRIPERSGDGRGDSRLQGVQLDINQEGRTEQFSIVDIPCPDETA